MTMHLLPVFVTTTKYNSKKKSSTKLKQSKFEHEQFIQKMTKGKKFDSSSMSKSWQEEYKEQISVDRSNYVSAGIDGNCSKPEPKTYTGKNLLGIAMMHKSNLVPVFSTEDAKDISSMRR